MGTRTILFDDLKPTEEADETISFSIDRKEYSIDLSSPNAQAMREALKPFIAAARCAGRPANVVSINHHSASRTVSVSRKPATMDRDQSTAIREWAQRHGFKCSARGRIPAAVLDAYANQDTKTGKPAANETAPRLDGAPATAPAVGPDNPRNAEDMDEFKIAFKAWAEARGYRVNKASGLGAPPVVKKFSRETGLYKPQETLPKAG